MSVIYLCWSLILLAAMVLVGEAGGPWGVTTALLFAHQIVTLIGLHRLFRAIDRWAERRIERRQMERWRAEMGIRRR